MRIERAIDAYLGWRELERDSTPRTLDSYRRILDKLADLYPEAQLSSFNGRDGTERLRDFLKAWADRSMHERGIRLNAATRSNIIPVLHSFFGWAEAEDLLEVDPSRGIQRPPKRRPKITRPQPVDLIRLREAAGLFEMPAIVLMEGAGLRRAEVLGCRWQDVDLLNGRVHIHRKGDHWDWLPFAPDVVDVLRDCFRQIEPGLDHYVFTVEVELWASQHHRVRRRKDPTRPASEQSLWRMVKRVPARPRNSHRTRCVTASQIASCGRAERISSRFKPSWVTPDRTRRSGTQMNSRLTN
jgi:site-specific recombinase XerC